MTAESAGFHHCFNCRLETQHTYGDIVGRLVCTRCGAENDS